MCRLRVSVVNYERWPTYKDGQVTRFTQLHKTRGFSSELINVAIQCCQGICHENMNKNCEHVVKSKQ